MRKTVLILTGLLFVFACTIDVAEGSGAVIDISPRLMVFHYKHTVPYSQHKDIDIINSGDSPML